MPNVSRRRFLEAGAILSALAVAPRVVAARNGLTTLPLPEPWLRAAISVIERGLPDASAFRRATAHLPTVIETGLDLGQAWMRVIEPELRRRPAAIVGLTSAASLFSLHLMARDFGLELESRVDVSPASVTWLITPRAGARAPLKPAESGVWLRRS